MALFQLSGTVIKRNSFFKKKFLLLSLLSWCFNSSNVFSGPLDLIQEKGCDQCHAFYNSKSRELQKAPRLDYAGEKFQLSWLEDFLQKPITIRLAGFSLAPDFLSGKNPSPHLAITSEEAKTIAKYLLNLRISISGPIVDSKALSKSQQVLAKIKFERDYGCAACHQAISLAGKPRGGISGPSLVDAGNRLNPDWIYRWLMKPHIYVLKGRMPVYKLKSEEAILIVKYIMTLKKENLR